jgi:hypothetical protein
LEVRLIADISHQISNRAFDLDQPVSNKRCPVEANGLPEKAEDHEDHNYDDREHANDEPDRKAE